MRLCAGVGVHLLIVSIKLLRMIKLTWVNKAYLSLATSQGDVDKSAGVRESLLGAALGGLGLLLLLNLFGYLLSASWTCYSVCLMILGEMNAITMIEARVRGDQGRDV